MTFPDWPLSALHARLVPLIKLPLLGLFATLCICCCIIHTSAAVYASSRMACGGGITVRRRSKVDGYRLSYH